MLPSCLQEKPQYGKDALKLDHFQFDLDLDHFFKDESIFVGTNDEGFTLSSEEVRFENDSALRGFIQYSSRTRSVSRPLAQYAGVPFEDLGLVTDWNDEKIWMACGSSRYKSSQEIMKILQQLKKEYNKTPELYKGGFSSNKTLYFIFNEAGKEVQFGVNLPNTNFIKWPEKSYWSGDDDKDEASGKALLLTDDIEKSVEQLLNEQAENTCYLFITTAPVAKAMQKQSGRSGFLVDYCRKNDR